MLIYPAVRFILEGTTNPRNESRQEMKSQSKFVYSVAIAIASLFFCFAVVATVGILPDAAKASPLDRSFTPAPGGTPMYTWGNNDNGQLGLGDFGPDTQRPTPTRVGTASNWVQVSSAAGGSVALNAEGHIYTWGAAWTAPQMGQGANPDNPNAGIITVPTRLGDRDDWVSVLSVGSQVTAITVEGHLYTWGANGNGQLGVGDTDPRDVPTRVGTASNWVAAAAETFYGIAINDEGHLYTWGSNPQGQLGQGFVGGEIQLTPQRVGTASNWEVLGTAGNAAAAINSDGELFTWGANPHGQLGHGDTDSRHVPTRVGTANNWVDVVKMAGATIALNSDGELFTWGQADLGRLGRPVTGAAPNTLPGKVGTRSDWITIGAGNSTGLVMSNDLELWAWGNNSHGQVGTGTIGGFVSSPTFILQAYGLAGFSQSGGGTQSLALIKTDPLEVEFDLTKCLQRPEGTDIDGDINFTFAFDNYSFNDNLDDAVLVPEIPNRTITLNANSPSSTENSIATATGAANIFEGISFSRPGVYSWKVRELPTAGIVPPATIIDSQAEYILQVNIGKSGGIGGSLFVGAITLYRTCDDAGEELNPPLKTNDFFFTNRYSRATQGTDDHYGALTISKTALGEFADLSTLFDFDVTITKTAFCPEDSIFEGQVYDSEGAMGNPIAFPSGTSTHIQLSHGQRLVFDEFLVGTRFSVIERPSLNFSASVDLAVNGNMVSVGSNTAPDTALSIGTHIAGDSENSVAFTNTHHYVPPTGLALGSPPFVMVVVAITMLLAFFAQKRRRDIEELSAV